MSEDKPFRIGYAHSGYRYGSNYNQTMEMLARAIKDNDLKIELVEIPYGEIDKLKSRITQLETLPGKAETALDAIANDLNHPILMAERAFTTLNFIRESLK